MNKEQLDYRLGSEKAEMAAVDDDLHRRLMRSVANASSARRSSWVLNLMPTLTAGAMATLAAVLIWSNVTQTTDPESPPTVVTAPQAGVAALNQRVAAMGSEVRLPEAALRQELQRLESDLKRFYVSS